MNAEQYRLESQRPLPASLDLERLLKLRVVVARVGEMDLAQWWNTKGQLGPLGAAAVRRGLPRTHYFAQARSVFAVAAHHCDEVYNPPGSVTLWRLPDTTEEQFEARWELWLDDARAWDPFFEEIAHLDTIDLLAALERVKLVTEGELGSLSSLTPSAGGRAVELPTPYAGTMDEVALLAMGFSRGRVRAPAVPWARLAAL